MEQANVNAEKKPVVFDCWACRKKITAQANSEGNVIAACPRCSLQFSGPESYWRSHRSDGFALQLPLRAKAKQFRVVVVE